MSAVITPFVGLLVDFVGRRGYMLLFSSSIMVLAHILWTVVPICKIFINFFKIKI